MTERLLVWFEGAVGTALSDLRDLRGETSPKDQWTGVFGPSQG
jgi:hypothetical protein